MATTPTYALPYPLPSDPVAQGADAIRKLAVGVENMHQVGSTSLDLSTADTNASKAVTFPVSYASGVVPTVVMATSQGPAAATGSTHAMWASGRAANGFTAGARRTQALASFSVFWIAVGAIGVVTAREPFQLDEGFVMVTVTCQTSGCDRQGVPLELPVMAEPWPPAVECGTCGQPITDVVAQ